MNKDNLISIIMPVYNKEKYVKETLKGILNQTYKNFELIIIDDCSKDNSKNIIEEYIDDNRIIFVENKLNLGAAKSRNKGYKYSRGEYVMFIDADDLLEPNLLEKLNESIDKTSAELIFIEFDNYKENKYNEGNILQRIKNYKEITKFNQLDYIEKLSLRQNTFNRIIKRDLIDRYNLEFQNLKCSNDVSFAMLTTILAKKIDISNEKVLYHYREGIKEQISNNRRPINNCLAYVNIWNELKKLNKEKENIEFLAIRLINNIKYELETCKSEKYIKECENYIENNFLKNMPGFIECLENTYLEKFFLSKNLVRNIRTINNFNMMLEIKFKKIEEFVEYNKLNNLKYAFWGYGQKGKSFIEFCREKEMQIPVIIENDGKKYGKYGEVEVVRLEKIINKIDYIIIPYGKYYEDIVKQINKRIKILDIEHYIYDEIKIKDYIKYEEV